MSAALPSPISPRSALVSAKEAMTGSELAMLPRLLLASIGWAILLALGPGGALGGDPHAAALLGVAVLAYAAGRPGPRAFLVEWFVSACAAAILLHWLRFVLGPMFILCGLIYGFHGAVFGIVLRRVLRDRAWAVAVPVAWCAMEVVRFLVPLPLGMRWIQLGHHAVELDSIVGAARVFGPTGLSYVLAALAGLLLDSAQRRVDRWAAVAGLAPLGLAALLSWQTSLPESVPGPRVLLIQPAIPQARKQGADPLKVYREQVELTRESLEAALAEDDAPDIVCWGETMLRIPLAGDTLVEAVRMGTLGEVSCPGLDLGPEDLPQAVATWQRLEARLVYEQFFGPGGERLLPEGAAFVAGAEVFVLKDGEVRRWNAVCAWSPDGQRRAVCPKLELVPGGETLYGLESIGFVRDIVKEFAGYVPNLLAGEATGVMELPASPERSERSWRATGTVCYDNSFLHPYTDPIARGEAVDLHLICSNEAWYYGSWEMDQMVCMSRMIAISTAKPVVRATNSGVSCVLDAEGRELGRIRDASGADREVAGHLSLEVPIQPKTASMTPFCRFRPYISWLFLLLAVALGWGSSVSRGY